MGQKHRKIDPISSNRRHQAAVTQKLDRNWEIEF